MRSGIERENSGHEYATLFIAAPMGQALVVRLVKANGLVLWRLGSGFFGSDIFRFLRFLRLLGGEFIVRLRAGLRAGNFPKFDVSVHFSGVENLTFTVEAGFAEAGNVGSRLSMTFSGVENVASSFDLVFREPKILLSHFQRVLRRGFREPEMSLKVFRFFGNSGAAKSRIATPALHAVKDRHSPEHHHEQPQIVPARNRQPHPAVTNHPSPLRPDYRQVNQPRPHR